MIGIILLPKLIICKVERTTTKNAVFLATASVEIYTEGSETSARARTIAGPISDAFGICISLSSGINGVPIT